MGVSWFCQARNGPQPTFPEPWLDISPVKTPETGREEPATSVVPSSSLRACPLLKGCLRVETLVSRSPSGLGLPIWAGSTVWWSSHPRMV